MKKVHLPNVDSTNEYLKRNYKSLENYTFVSCDNQTAGRGRYNRIWKSENGKNLLFSLLILDSELINHFKEISIIFAYSIIKELENLGLNDLSIKWPNDIYYKDKKLCGILLESVSTNTIDCLIAGVGLNVNQVKYYDDYIHEPISIKNILNKDIPLDDLKDNIYSSLLNSLDDIKKGESYYQRISRYDYLKDKVVYADIDDEKKLVKVIGINEDFSLKIAYNDKLYDKETGEISFHV